MAGLEVASRLLPPTCTHDANSVADMGIKEARRDRVYFTIDRELAHVFASAVPAATGQRAPYRVDPVGEMDIDPDFPTVGFQVKQAPILEVAERNVTLSDTEELERQRPYLMWNDGRHIYSEAGRVQINPQPTEMGYKTARL